MSEMLKTFLATTTVPLVLVDDTTPGFADSLLLPEGVTVERLRPDREIALDTVFKAVLLCVPDRGALRRVIGLVPRLGNARTFAVYLAQADSPPPLMPRPEWPALKAINGKTSPTGEAITVIRLSGAISATSVLAEFARGATSSYQRGEGPLVLGLAGASRAHLPYGDTATVIGTSVEAVVDPEIDVPPDVVLAAGSEILAEHEVLGRAPVVVDLSTEPAPIDELVINPIGYTSDASQPVSEIRRLGAAWRIKGPHADVLVDASVGLTEPTLAQLRDLRGVALSWPAEWAPGLRRLLAGLAMAGVPVVSDPVPPWAAPLLGSLADVVANPVDLDDPLRRDEHSVRLRRAAFAEHSGFAWRGRLAAKAGVRPPEHPSVSIVLATKRPHQLEHALAQVVRQRGVEVELVLATHGFAADPGTVRDAAGDVRVVQLDFPETTAFGDVLTAAAQAASGDLVLKFDDDDWYGPDAVTDLLLARRYSGAPVVGMPAEFAYLEPVDTTIRRNDRTEFYARFVAGGTILIDRGLLRSVGWFRTVRKYVDLQLLTAVQAAGAPIYRTHGLGYVMRRTGEGHTWEPGIDYFLTEERVGTTYAGFSPSLLLELPEPD